MYAVVHSINEFALKICFSFDLRKFRVFLSSCICLGYTSKKENSVSSSEKLKQEVLFPGTLTAISKLLTILFLSVRF